MSVRGGIVPVLVLLSLALPVRADDPAEGEVVHLPDRDVYVHNPNYDVAKIPSYVLEDPLTFLNGRKVTAANWEDRRREILGIFAREMYGAEPPAPEAVVTEGEFLSVRAASPAWGLLRGSGLPEVSWPAPYDTAAIGRRLGYVRRTEAHGQAAVDWRWLLDFADGALDTARRNAE